MNTCGNAAPNCTLWFDGNDFRRLRADPDVAGIGVIVAMVTSNFLTTTIAAASLIFGMIRGLNDNAIDRLLVSQLQKIPFLRVGEKRFKFWQPVMESLILALSDQQLLVGISILITGFIKHCTISVHHFGIISDLAWFSSNTNLSSLVVLHIYLSEHPALRNRRVCLTLVMFVFLMVSYAFQGHRQWYDSWNIPAQCLLDGFLMHLGGEPAKYMAIRTVLLIYNYSTSIAFIFKNDGINILLFERPVERMGRDIARLQDRIVTLISEGGWKSFLAPVLLMPAWTLVSVAKKALISIATIMESVALSLCMDIFWFSFGIWTIISHRHIPKSLIRGDENEWGFGQVVQILLLTSIALTFKDLYSHQSAKHAQRVSGSGTKPSAQTPLQPDDASGEHPDDSESSESINVAPARRDTEAGGREGGTSGIAAQYDPPGHSLVHRTPSIAEGATLAH